MFLFRRCNVLENLMSVISDDDDLNNDSLTNIALCLNVVLNSQFEERVFPDEINNKYVPPFFRPFEQCILELISKFCCRNIEESINKPMFILFSGLTQSLDSSSKRIPFFTILTELRSHQPKLGYLFLYYLQVCELSRDNEKPYS